MDCNLLKFEIKKIAICNNNGDLTKHYDVNIDDLLRLYKVMSLIRVFDKKAISLHRHGKIGTFPSSYGQEAIYSTIGLLMTKEDILCPYYRDHAALYMRGVKLSEILLYWSGDERGNKYQNNNCDMPVCVPIASQCLHACGIAYAIKLQKKNNAVIVTLGDGASSKGDFYEAINFAGIYKLPVIFVINNNKWAISTPLDKQTAATSLAQKAIAAGIEGIITDGNDIFSLHKVLSDALNKAYKDGGPTVIEAQTYRLCDHTSVDDASTYADISIRNDAAKKEPLIRLKKYLQKNKLISSDFEDELEKEIKNEIAEELANFNNYPQPLHRDAYVHTYSEQRNLEKIENIDAAN